MSKRAEDYANKRFPPDIGEDYVPIPGGYEIQESDFNSAQRWGCRVGYEQAEKDTIERAVAWLKDNAEKYIAQTTESYPDAPFKAIIGGKCWEDLKKAMEEDK